MAISVVRVNYTDRFIMIECYFLISPVISTLLFPEHGPEIQILSIKVKYGSTI